MMNSLSLDPPVDLPVEDDEDEEEPVVEPTAAGWSSWITIPVDQREVDEAGVPYPAVCTRQLQVQLRAKMKPMLHHHHG